MFHITQQERDTTINGKKMKNIKYGLGNIAKNGCGVIATYNVLTALKKGKTKFDTVLKALRKSKSLLGLGGTKIGGIQKYIENKGLMVLRFNYLNYSAGAVAYYSTLTLIERTANAVIICFNVI